MSRTVKWTELPVGALFTIADGAHEGRNCFRKTRASRQSNDGGGFDAVWGDNDDGVQVGNPCFCGGTGDFIELAEPPTGPTIYSACVTDAYDKSACEATRFGMDPENIDTGHGYQFGQRRFKGKVMWASGSRTVTYRESCRCANVKSGDVGDFICDLPNGDGLDPFQWLLR